MHCLTQISPIWGKGGGGVVGASSLRQELFDYVLEGNNDTSFTYTLQIGDGDYVIIGTSFEDASPIATTGITLGGNPMTLWADNGTANNETQFFYIANPGGLTASVVVSIGSTCHHGVVGVWALHGTPDSWTPVDTLEIRNTAGTIDVSAGGVMFALEKYTYSRGGANWYGITRRFGGLLGSDKAGGSGASDDYASAETGRTILKSGDGYGYVVSLR